jgi:4-hydroxythreonine-4-phosphate dehydrogenase
MERLCITVGDTAGVGLEVILKSLPSPDLSDHALVIVGPFESVREAERRFGTQPSIESIIDNPREVAKPGCYLLREVEAGGSECQAKGTSSAAGGSEYQAKGAASAADGSMGEYQARAAVTAIKIAAEHCMNADCSAMVTAPVNKAKIARTMNDFRGQTEFIGSITGAREPTMMMASDKLRVALLTTHLPVSEVAGQLSKDRIVSKLRIIHHDLRTSWLIGSPRLAMLALNPHAGDSGLIGFEETSIMEPAIAEARADGIDVSGPFSSDAFFARDSYKNFDIVVSAYHDQGLIPFKLLSEGGGVNVTLGLPIIRTSPEHGTAFDIAGRGVADPTSMINAIALAARLSRNRRSSV